MIETDSQIVDRIIVEHVLPACYQLISDLMDVVPINQGNAMKLRVGKILPAQYKHSFRHKPLPAQTLEATNHAQNGR